MPAVNIKNQKCDVYVGRPSIWGNPYVIGTHGTRKEVIRMYRQHILSTPHLLQQIPTLKGKTLGCHCAPKACHADVLSELANAIDLFT